MQAGAMPFSGNEGFSGRCHSVMAAERKFDRPYPVWRT